MTKAIVVLASLLVLSRPMHGLERFASCLTVEHWLRTDKFSTDTFARIEELDLAAKALVVGDSNNRACRDWVIERTRWELADYQNRYSTEFPGNDAATKTQAKKAAASYIAYLDWLLSLNPDRLSRLIDFLLLGERVPEGSPVFHLPKSRPAERAAWLRTRPGGALVGLATCLVRAQEHDRILAEFSRMGARSTEIFNEEAVDEWYKWIRAYPDYKRLMQNSEVVEKVKLDPGFVDILESFDRFLKSYCLRNPSAADRWTEVRGRVLTWLANSR